MSLKEDEMLMSNSFYHKELTDAQWNKIKSLFPEPKKVGRRPLNPRKVFNGILWILKSGARWRDLPAHYGNWNSIYHKFRLWGESGLFRRLVQVINTNAHSATLLELDSTFCKVHQSTFSGLINQAIGVSRGGKTTKIHVLINERIQLMNVILTGGLSSLIANRLLLFLPTLSFQAKMFLPIGLTRLNQSVIILKSICIPDKANFGTKHDFDAELYKRRNLVERFFQRIKNYRHVATRYDKLALCFENFVFPRFVPVLRDKRVDTSAFKSLR